MKLITFHFSSSYYYYYYYYYCYYYYYYSTYNYFLLLAFSRFISFLSSHLFPLSSLLSSPFTPPYVVSSPPPFLFLSLPSLCSPILARSPPDPISTLFFSPFSPLSYLPRTWGCPLIKLTWGRGNTNHCDAQFFSPTGSKVQRRLFFLFGSHTRSPSGCNVGVG